MGDNKFILGLDLDNVSSQYTTEFRRFVSRFTGRPESEFPEPTEWNFSDSGWGISNEDYLTYHARAVEQGMFRSMEPMPGVSKALWELSDAGVHIRIVTHRLIKNQQHQTVAADTCSWLDRENIPYRDICFLGEKSDVNADVFIDDAPHNIDALRTAGKSVLIFDHAYNRACAGTRVKNWDEAKAAVLAAMEAKNRRNAA